MLTLRSDSLDREFTAYLMSFNGVIDTTKFQYADVMLEEAGVRVSFFAWQDLLMRGHMEDRSINLRGKAFLTEMMDHFNILKAGSSKDMNYPEIHVESPKKETSPDVFVLNAANAYALYMQSESTFKQWVDDFAEICGDVFVKGRAGDNKKTHFMWYGNPYLHGAAHGGTEFISQGRNVRFNDIAK